MSNVLSWIKQSNTKENPLLRLSPVRPHEFSGDFITPPPIPILELNKLKTNSILVFQVKDNKTQEIILFKDLEKIQTSHHKRLQIGGALLVIVMYSFLLNLLINSKNYNLKMIGGV